MKQTAVEWLYEHILLTPLDIRSINKCLEKAKAMEKEQIKDFFNAGVRYGSGSVMSTEWGEDTEEYNFEQYYNETFKSE